MLIVFFSSVFNHHSLPLCDALNQQQDVTCYFVETMEEEEERRQLGYHPYARDYVLNMLESEENRQKALDLALTADVMIAGVFPYAFLKERLLRNKLTFLCQERMFKGDVTWLRRVRAWLYNMRKFFAFRNKPLYLLAIGKNAALDYKSIGFYRNKCFQWAYFPPFISYDWKELVKKKDHTATEILFAGRLIPLKHPEYALRATKDLLRKGYQVRLTYIGTGEMETDLRKEAEEIKETVSFLGAMSPEQVRKHMEEGDIFAFTSNSLEGWGAVVNEAMNAGCAIVAGSAPGAVVTMIRDGENGCVYEEESYQQFYEKFEMLVAAPDQVRRLGEAAYKTISEQYNADVAAARFCEQCRLLLRGNTVRGYDEGIMKIIC
jgi:glycosyltransferase involved in cell wall biosynthesis